MSEWREVPIRDLCRRTTSGGTPSRARPDYFCDPPAGIPWVRSQELVDRTISRVGQHITPIGLDRSSAKIVPPDSVLIAMYGATVGKLGYLTIEAATNQAVCALIADPAATSPRFLYYLLMHARPDLITHAHGAAQQNLSQDRIRGFSLRVPPLLIQRRIADMLTTIDDLTENNRRRIELLEQTTQAIYREWFVRFRYPGHDSDAPLVVSPLGPIPDGWNIGIVADMCTRVQAGGTPRRSEALYWEGGEIDWYKTGDLTDSILIHSSERISEYAVSHSTARTFQHDTILMAIYGSPTVGRLGLVMEESSANQAALGLVADPSVSTTEHLWFTLVGLREHLNQIAQGAAQQNVSKAKVVNAPVVIPPFDLVRRFTTDAGPSWRLSHRLQREIHVLASIRDLLLPKLVTGQIDVTNLDLDALLESVA